jgi:hypothetical protein
MSTMSAASVRGFSDSTPTIDEAAHRPRHSVLSYFCIEKPFLDMRGGIWLNPNLHQMHLQSRSASDLSRITR